MKEIIVRIKVNPGKPNYCCSEVISEKSKCATQSYKDKDDTIVVERPDGIVRRLTLP